MAVVPRLCSGCQPVGDAFPMVAFPIKQAFLWAPQGERLNALPNLRMPFLALCPADASGADDNAFDCVACQVGCCLHLLLCRG